MTIYEVDGMPTCYPPLFSQHSRMVAFTKEEGEALRGLI